MKDLLWFFYLYNERYPTYNISHPYHFILQHLYSSENVLSIVPINESIKQILLLTDNNGQRNSGFTRDFLLIALTIPPASQISTTINKRCRQVFVAFSVNGGSRHPSNRDAIFGNRSAIVKMGQTKSLCKAKGKIQNEYAVVSVSLISHERITFDSANIGNNGYCIVRQWVYFQSEDRECNGH